MGNFLERILNRMNVTDEDDFDDFDDFDSEIPSGREKKKAERLVQEATTEETPSFRKEASRVAPVAAAKPVKPQKSFEEDKFEYEYSESRRERAQRPAPSRVVPLRSVSASSSRSLEVSIMKPTRFDDSQDICDMLVDERATVVNLEGIDLALAQRIMDFISGAVYALNGKIHQISGLIFIVSPENVDISGDYLSYVEQNGFEVPTLNQ